MWVCVAALAVGLVAVGRWRRSGRSAWEFLVLSVARGYARLWHRWHALGRVPLPATGPGLLYANHTSSADPTFVSAGSPRILSFLIAEEYYAWPPLACLFRALHSVPVRRTGRDVSGARRALRRLSEGRIVAIFPEGGLSNAGRGRVGRLRAGLAWLALRSRAPVYPAWISGGPQTSSLPRAWLVPSRRAVRVHYGPAVDLSRYHGRRIDRRLLEEVSSYLTEQLQELGRAGQSFDRGPLPHRGLP
jgi:1-acyl-sn-glycerol-3-phosphate acyltransferase